MRKVKKVFSVFGLVLLTGIILLEGFLCIKKTFKKEENKNNPSPIVENLKTIEKNPLSSENPPSKPTQSEIQYLQDGNYLLNLVTKNNALLPNYTPKDLVELQSLGLAQKKVYIRKIVIEDLKNMLNSAKKEGISLYIISGFRSWETQKQLYENAVKREGEKNASLSVAKPGHSEHQLGTAIDFGCNCSADLTESFENTPQGKWLLKNAYKYGFVLSYPEGKTKITGYLYEPWHFRYIGKENALGWYKSHLTLTEFLTQKPQYYLPPS